MNTYSIISEGNPIIPYTLQVDLEINANCSYEETVTSGLQGTELTSFFEGYVANSESTFKSHSDFITQDTVLNATPTLDDIGENPDDSSKRMFKLTYSFSVSNAVARFTTNCQSSQEGEDLEAFFNSKVAEVDYEFYNVRPQWTKVS
jgi:hypothetical protein